MVNALQLIVHVPMFSIAFPSNAYFFFSLIIGIINFDVVPTEELLKAIFNFDPEDEAVNLNFDFMGYSSHNLMLNLGAIFLYFSVIVFLLLLFKICKPIMLDYEKGKRLYNWFSKKMHYGFQIRFGMECYLEFAIAAFINV